MEVFSESFRRRRFRGPQNDFSKHAEILIFGIPEASHLRRSIRLVKLVSPLLARAYNLPPGVNICKHISKKLKIVSFPYGRIFFPYRFPIFPGLGCLYSPVWSASSQRLACDTGLGSSAGAWLDKRLCSIQS